MNPELPGPVAPAGWPGRRSSSPASGKRPSRSRSERESALPQALSRRYRSRWVHPAVDATSNPVLNRAMSKIAGLIIFAIVAVANLSSCGGEGARNRKTEAAQLTKQLRGPSGGAHLGHVESTGEDGTVLSLKIEEPRCWEDLVRSIADPNWDGPGFISEFGPRDLQRWILLGFKRVECDNYGVSLPVKQLTSDEMREHYRRLRKRYAAYDIYQTGLYSGIACSVEGVEDRVLVMKTDGKCGGGEIEVAVQGGELRSELRKWTTPYPAASIGFTKVRCEGALGSRLERTIEPPSSLQD